jgi:general secretion pathway protein G
MKSKWAKQKGFTIVELLIVIVVIGILAAITIVAYNGIQQRGRDAQRKSDLSQISKSLHLYNVDKGNYVDGSDGCAGGNGWYHYDYDGAGSQTSVSLCLVNGKYISADLNDPQTSKGCTTVATNEQECFYYMKYECAGSTYLYANLESMPHSSTDTDTACMVSLDSMYGMNYFVKVR